MFLCKKISLDRRPYTFHKISSKLDHRHKRKHKTIKLIEDNTGKNLDDLGLGDDFVDTTPNTLPMKEITDKLDFIII